MAAATNGAQVQQAQDVSADEFKASFENTRALIEKNWPDVDAAALEATAGDLEKVTALIAKSHARVHDTLKRQLGELHRAAEPKPPSRLSAVEERLEALLGRLETRANTVTDRVKTDLLPLAESKMKSNIWQTILVCLGIGIILGLFTGRGSRRV